MADILPKYRCTYCQEDISDVFIRCAECADFDLCLQCYSWGVQLGDHNNDHAYQLLKSTTDSVFPGIGAWSAGEQMRLLDGIEQFGFGNWEDIAKHIETRTSEEAKNEYISHFLDGTIGRATWGEVASTSQLIDHLPPGSRIPIGPHSTPEGESTSKEAVRNDECAQLGYMPKRDDYEREYDPEAEQMISSLAVSGDDDDLDIALKMAVICAYNRRIAERSRRKQVANSYQLISQFFSSINNKQPRNNDKLEKEKREFLDKLRVFAQLMPQNEYVALEENLWGERLARMRLAELYHYRMNGLTSLDECEHYEQHAAYRRHCHMRNYLAAGSSGGTVNSTVQSTRDRSPLNRTNQRRRENENGSSSTSPKYIRDASIECGCYRKRFYSKTRGCNITEPSTANTSMSRRGAVGSNSVALSTQSLRLLTNSEQQICTSLNVTPDTYLTMKTVMLSSNRNKYLYNQSPLVKYESDMASETAVSRYINRAGWTRVPSA